LLAMADHTVDTTAVLTLAVLSNCSRTHSPVFATERTNIFDVEKKGSEKVRQREEGDEESGVTLTQN